MKRADAIAAIRFAGYHASSDWVRVYIENRVSHAVALQAYRDGAAAKRSGVRCSCFECKSSDVRPAPVHTSLMHTPNTEKAS